MTRAALAYLPLPASPRPARSCPQPRRKHLNPFSRLPRLQPKPRLGVKNHAPRYASGPALKTHENPPEITPVAAEAAAGCSVAAESRTISVLERTGCFVAGTQVHTREGLRPTEDISVGDYVLSQPERGGERGYRKVIETFVYEDKSILAVTYQDASGRTESVEATYLHPFWVKGLGWQGAQYLKVRQVVELHDGREANVVSLTETGRNDRVHNFTVDGFHTYYVGELGIWVHNVGECGEIAIRDLDLLHSPETIGARPDIARLSDSELLEAVRNPLNGDRVKISTATGKVVDGNSRVLELQRRAADPLSGITPGTTIPFTRHTPDNSTFWDF